MRDIAKTCYLDYVGLGYFDPNSFRNPMERYAKDYNDPDACCNELYLDLLEIYKKKFAKLGFELSKSDGEYILWMEKDHVSYTMSSDFIGPSRASARDAGISNIEVGEYLRKTRVIGGHTLWPVQYRENDRNTIVLTGRGGTINTQRGGNKGFCDRIDCTLYDLKNYYATVHGQDFKYKIGAFEKYKNWLLLFDNFEFFIDFFYLNDFCDSDYRVYDLKSYDPTMDRYDTFIGEGYQEIDNFKITDEDGYKSFISGSVKAILSRQLRIREDLIR